MPHAAGRGVGRKRGRPQKKTSTRTSQRRPVVISLDVTYSSEEEAAVWPSSPKVAPDDDDDASLQLTPSPENKPRRGVMSDSDSDWEVLECKTLSPVVKKMKISDQEEQCCSDSDFDPFEVDYNFYHQLAMKNASKEIQDMDKYLSLDSCQKQGKSKIQSDIKDDDVCVVEDDISKIIEVHSPTSPTLLDIGNYKQKKRRQNKKTKKALSRLSAITRELKQKDLADKKLDLSIGSDGVFSCDEDDINPEIKLRVKWGSDYLRMPMKTMQKFSHMYQQLAERFSVSVGQIVLSHNDKVINSALCPHDLGITIADIIEGGIQLQAITNGEKSTSLEKRGPDSLCLKVQSAERKGLLNIYINRYDKMSVLMHKYAMEKNISIDKLKFLFDGEILDPRDTPESLDLDGGECIDVYDK